MSYYTEADCRIEDFAALCARQVDPAHIPHAAAVESNVVVYDMSAQGAALSDPAQRRTLRLCQAPEKNAFTVSPLGVIVRSIFSAVANISADEKRPLCPWPEPGPPDPPAGRAGRGPRCAAC